MSESRTINLPQQRTPFIGRENELAEIAHLLADPTCRLLTLVGPGGIGKTRLAVETARQFALPDGVYFVPLQPLASSDHMVSAIADSLHFHFRGERDPKQQLLDYLREKSLLLILDNMEHLLDGVELLLDILKAASNVKLLVTSRERLNLQEEWVLDIGGLSYPANDDETDIERYSAVELFVRHARRVNNAFTLHNGQKSAVTRICRLVGGMPLGIELAAAWVRALSCEQIASELERSLDILETTARNVEPRHRTMRAAFEPTWKRLSDDKRAVFMRLSVFRGGFTREAAEYVAGATLRVLSALVDKSLLRVDTNGRYDVHELLRQYAESQADEINARETRNAHSAHYAGYLFRRVADLKGRRQLDALAEIHVDFENVRAAWYWAVDHHHVQMIEQMIEGLWVFCELANRELEGYTLFRYAEQRCTSDDGTESLWRLLLARAAIGEGLEVELENALHIARGLNDPVEAAFCLARLGKAAHRNGENLKAEQLLLDSLTIYRQLDDNFAASGVLYWLLTTSVGENWEEFKRYGEEALRRSSAIGDQFGVARSLSVAAVDAARSGRFEEAESLWFKRIALGKKIHNLEMVAGSYLILSDRVYFFQGKFEQARAAAEESIRIINNLGLPPANQLVALGIIASASGDYEAGIRLCKQGTALAWDPDTYKRAAWGIAIASCGLGDYATAQDSLLTTYLYLTTMFGPVGHVAILTVIAVIRAHRGNHIRAVELLGLAFTHPIRASGWMEKWALLDRLRAELEGRLGSEAYAAAWERGSHLNLEQTAHQLVRQLQSEAGDAAAHANHALIEPLTERELEILQLVADGLSNREIADQLFLAVNTIKYYNYQIFSKLHVTNRTQAAARARELGLLT